MTQQVLLYLHGFLSSPNSLKATQTRDFLKQHHPDIEIVCPQLPYHPEPTKKLLLDIIEQYRDAHIGLIGSSLGGFLSSYLVEQIEAKAVLVNPAVTPYKVLDELLGEHTHPYTQETFLLEPIHMKQLQAMDTPQIRFPERYWVLLQTGDETLDYRLAEAKYQCAKLTIEQGGDHAFQGFDNYLPEIIEYLFFNQ